MPSARAATVSDQLRSIVVGGARLACLRAQAASRVATAGHRCQLQIPLARSRYDPTDGGVCEITSAVFQASDLAGAKRREFLGAAREGGALLRDTDGFALTMVPLAQLEAITEIAQVAVAALLALAALSRGSARPADLGQLAWLAAFDEDDRAEFFEELRDALSVAAATRDAAPVETCLREWRTTAQALSDPLRRAILTAPGDDDYAEVDRPQE